MSLTGLFDHLHRLAARMPPWFWALGALTLAALILWAGSRPGDTLPDMSLRLPHEDKLKHFLAFGLLGALLFRWRYPFQNRRPAIGEWPWVPALVVPMIVGVLDEINQATVPGRSSDIADVVADALGGATALALGLWLRARARRRCEAHV